MLSVGSDAHRFSPSQNIYVTRSAPHQSVMYITDKIPKPAHIPNWRQAWPSSGGIVFPLRGCAPSSEVSRVGHEFEDAEPVPYAAGEGRLA
jgi:hypothetical protein